MFPGAGRLGLLRTGSFQPGQRIHMASYKEPSFQDRAALMREARQKALANFKAKPQVDAATIAERLAAQAQRDATVVARREARHAELAAAKAEKAAAQIAAAQLQAASVKPELTDEQRKLARDAKYAARKQGKR